MSNRIKIQLIVSLFVILVCGAIAGRFQQDGVNDIQAGRADVAQTNASGADLVKARDAQHNSYVSDGILGGGLILVFLIWTLPYLNDKFNQGKHRNHTKTAAFMTLAIVVPLLLSACGQNVDGKRTRLVILQASDTGFVVSTAEADQQKVFQSEALLEQAKVPIKQINMTYSRYLKEKSGIGGQQDTYDWKANSIVYIVDRAPVSRSWTAESTTGTNSSNQALKLESNEAIDFYLGITCNAQVTEQDASKFLYYFSGVTREPVKDKAFDDVPGDAVFRSANLGTVMDNNIRNWLEPRLFSDLHKQSFNDIRLNVATVIDAAVVDMKKEFTSKGITITSCGGQGGITPTDPKIQDAINANFAQSQQNQRDRDTAANQQQIAQANLAAQETKNKQALAQAQNDAAVAKTRQEQDIAYQQQQADLYAKHPEYVQSILAQKWDGHAPQYVGGGNNNAPYVSVTPNK